MLRYHTSPCIYTVLRDSTKLAHFQNYQMVTEFISISFAGKDLRNFLMIPPHITGQENKTWESHLQTGKSTIWTTGCQGQHDKALHHRIPPHSTVKWVHLLSRYRIMSTKILCPYSPLTSPGPQVCLYPTLLPSIAIQIHSRLTLDDPGLLDSKVEPYLSLAMYTQRQQKSKLQKP